MKIKIESGIPLPAPGAGTGRPKGELRLAIAAMQPGDSFVVPRERGIAQIKHAAKAEGIRVACRLWNCASRRVWRVA